MQLCPRAEDRVTLYLQPAYSSSQVERIICSPLRSFLSALRVKKFLTVAFARSAKYLDIKRKYFDSLREVAMSLNSFGAATQLKVGDKSYKIYDLKAVR